MGNYQSSVTRQFISSVNNIINQSATSVYNQASQQCSAINLLTANFGSSPDGQTCPVTVINSRINFRQGASVTCNLDSVNHADLNTQFTNEVQQQLQQLASTDIQNKQGFLSTAISIQENNLSSEQQLINAITNTLSQNITNLCTTVNQASNQGNLVFCGVYQDTTIDVAQNATIQAITSCVNEAIVKVQVGNTTIADIIQRTDNKLASEQQGVGSLLWIIIAVIGGILLLGIIGFVIFMLIQPRGGGATQVVAPPPIPGVPSASLLLRA